MLTQKQPPVGNETSQEIANRSFSGDAGIQVNFIS